MNLKDLSLKNKIKILHRIEKKPENTPVRELEKFFSVPKSNHTVVRLKHDEIKLRKNWCSVQISKAGKQKRRREGCT